MADELTPQEKRFVERYVISLNASKAAREAGYSDHRHANRILHRPHVEAAINERLEQIGADNAFLAQEVRRVLACQMTYSLLDILNPDGTIRSLKEMPEDAHMAIQDFSKKTFNGGEVTRLKLVSRVAAAKALAPLIGMNRPKPEDDGSFERGKIRDAGESLRGRIDGLGERLRRVHRQPDGGPEEIPPI